MSNYSLLINDSLHLFHKNSKQISLLGKPGHPRVAALREGSIAPPTIIETPVKVHRGKAMRQITASFIANIGPMNTGLIFGFSAVCLPQLLSPSSSIPIDHNQASWVGECFFDHKI